jgi:hypothetical protein
VFIGCHRKAKQFSGLVHLNANELVWPQIGRRFFTHGVDNESVVWLCEKAIGFGCLRERGRLLQVTRQKFVDPFKALQVSCEQYIAKRIAVPYFCAQYGFHLPAGAEAVKVPGIAGIVDIGKRQGADTHFCSGLHQFFCVKRAVSEAKIGFAIEVHGRPGLGSKDKQNAK